MRIHNSAHELPISNTQGAKKDPILGGGISDWTYPFPGVNSRRQRLLEDRYVRDITQLPLRGILIEKLDFTIFMQRPTNISIQIDKTREFATDSEKDYTSSGLEKVKVCPLFFQPSIVNCG